MEFLHAIFAVLKFLFGLGALGGLLGIGFLLLWYLLRCILKGVLHGQPAERWGGLRKLFLES